MKFGEPAYFPGVDGRRSDFVHSGGERKPVQLGLINAISK